MSEEEKASGISVEELTEKESLIEELVEREDTIQAKTESALKQQFKDNETAEDIKVRASPKSRIKSKHAEPLVDFLQGKQRLTAKLDNRSYVQNNRNRKVNSK